MRNELTYTRHGDYLIPDLTLKETSREPLGKYGRMRQKYLKEHRPILWNQMILEETLFPHLLEIEQSARSQMQQTLDSLLKADPAPDKATRQMAWVQHMNRLKAQAEEQVLTELIYN